MRYNMIIIAALMIAPVVVAQMSPNDAMKQLQQRAESDRPTYDELAAEVTALKAERVKLKAQINELEKAVETITAERDALRAKYEPAAVPGKAEYDSVESLIAAFDQAVGLKPGANRIAQANANEWLKGQVDKSIKATLEFEKVSQSRDGFVVSTALVSNDRTKTRYGFLIRLTPERAAALENASKGDRIDVVGKLERVAVYASDSNITFSGSITDASAIPSKKR